MGRTACPHCGRRNNRHDKVAGPASRPQPGDAAICFTCGGIAIYTASGTQRRPTADEAAELAQDPRVARTRAALEIARSADEAVELTRWATRHLENETGDMEHGHRD